MHDWKLWFIQLSGWPVFLATVAAAVVFALAMSVALHWLGTRSIVQALVVAVIAMSVAIVALLGLLAIVSRL